MIEINTFFLIVHYGSFVITVFLYALRKQNISLYKKALQLIAWAISGLFQKVSAIRLI